MKKSPFLIAIIFPVILFSCAKDNKEAKKLDGNWKLNKWSWDGKDNIPSGSHNDTLGTWIFNVCKAASETCKGTVKNFPGCLAEERFDWYIREKGSKFTFGPDDASSPLGNFAGEWDIIELLENNLTITSNSCGGCQGLGRTRLEFSK
jgi:hypothetical protein